MCEEFVRIVEIRLAVCYNFPVRDIGDRMCEKIEVLGIQLDGYTAKEAMQETIRCLETEPISTIEILAGASVIELMETGDLRDKLSRMDLLVVGDRTLLDLSGIEDKTLLREAESNLFLKMFLRYLKKGHKKVFLLAPNEERKKKFQSIWNGTIPELRFPGRRLWRTSRE